MSNFERKINTVSTAKIINFEKAIVKADIDNGFDRIAGTLTDTLANPPCSLSGREYQVLNAIISKTYRYHKKTDWVASVQLAEITGIDKTNVSKIKTKLVRKNVLIEDGRKIGINPIISQWADEVKLVKSLKAVKNDYVNNSQKRLSIQSKMTSAQSKTTTPAVNSDPHNRKTILHKTINTIDKPAKRNTQIPNDFCITQEMRNWSVSKNHTINIDEETENFILYWKGAGKTKADWKATWQVWMNKNNKDSSPKNHSPRQSFQEQRTQRNMEVMNEFINGDNS